MGAPFSKPFHELTKEEIGVLVADLGDRYKVYSTLLIDHGIDGGLLDSLDGKGFQETLDDLGISNRLHRRVLQRVLEKAKESFSGSHCESFPRTSEPTNIEWESRDLKTETVVSAFNCNSWSHSTSRKDGDNIIALNLKRAQELNLFTRHQSLCAGNYETRCPADPKQTTNEPYHSATSIKPVLQRQVSQRAIGGNHIAPKTTLEVAVGPQRQASHKLPIFQSMIENAAHRIHLPSSFYDMVDAVSAPRPPIAKNDLERSAAVEALYLTEISPSDKIASHLESMVKMATDVFGFPYGEITFHNHEFQFRIASYCDGENAFGALNAAYQSIRRNSDGTPFLCKTGRGASICNYTIAANQTFLVQDLTLDYTFAWLNAVVPVRCYVGSPIKDSVGRVIANLCLFDTRPRPDFEAADEIQIEQFASMIAQSIESWALARAVERTELERNLTANGRNKAGPPRGNVTIVLTDIQGSTVLWESDPAAMQEALDLHDSIIRRHCADHWGYEIETEGDSFVLAFHDPVDAVAFALGVQMALFEAPWSDAILRLPPAKKENGAFRGLRVRIAIHQGVVSSDDSGRICYVGETMKLTKNLASMTNGGQILTTYETWDVASYFMGKKLGYPQVVDLGSHVLQKGKTMRDGLILKRIIQLVPCELAYDFFAARKLASPSDAVMRVPGRQFPSFTSCKQVSSSFHDAPHENNEVTVAFVNMSLVDDCLVTALENLICSLLDGCREFGGYHCHKEMIVFRRPLDAVMFGLLLKQELSYHDPQDDGANLAQLIKIGCIHGDFLTMGPHRKTGRADYFGQIVNRAARLSSAVKAGSVCLGVVCCGEKNDQEGSDAPVHNPSIEAQFCGRKLLRGIQQEIDVFEFTYACEL